MRQLLLALSHRLLMLAFDSAVRRALPEIFKRLDGQLIKVIGDGPDAVRDAIGDAIESVTKQGATADQIAGVVALYDPTAAAKRSSPLADAVRSAVAAEIPRQRRPGGVLHR